MTGFATLKPLDEATARSRGKGQPLEVLKVWPETKRLIDLSAGTFPGISRTEIYDHMIRFFLEETGRLAVVQQLAQLQMATEDEDESVDAERDMLKQVAEAMKG